MASVLSQETVDTNHYGILENKKVLKCGETTLLWNVENLPKVVLEIFLTVKQMGC